MSCLTCVIRWQKDVALVSLANVLHRSHFSNEAAIVMHAALDVSHDLNVNHFTLGNIYAVSTGTGDVSLTVSVSDVTARS